MSIAEKQAALVAEFGRLPDWESRYKLIIQKAKALPAMPEIHKVEKNQVRGCASTVWLHAGVRDGKVIYLADSDAILVRGLVAILVQIYCCEAPGDILAHDPTFIEELGLNANLSPNRANGVTAMVKQIRNYALAFQVMEKRGMTPPAIDAEVSC